MAKKIRVGVEQLHPLQVTLGMLEVDAKRKHFEKLDADALKQALKALPVPTVIGKHDRHYIIDHHHLVRALWDGKIADVYVNVLADLSHLSDDDKFWDAMIKRGWVHPYDEHGVLRALSAIPNDVSGMIDDPYRSLAGFVREGGGYIKTPEPFAEFQWAAFYRTRVPLWTTPFQFKAAVEQGIYLATSPDARTLPGFRQPQYVTGDTPE
jgi:hypothetical protein